MRQHPLLDQAHATVLHGLAGQLHAELRLPAGALEVHHQVARHLQRQRVAKVLLHHGQGQIDPGRDPGRSPVRPFAHIDGIGIHPHLGVAALQLLRHAPVRGRAAAVEQPGLGQEEAAAAQRNGARHLGRHTPHPVHQRRAGLQHRGDVARAHQQHGAARVLLHIGQGVRGLQRHQRVRAHQPALRGHHAQGIAIGQPLGAQVHVGVLKDRHRADGLQRLEAGVDDEIDAVGACVAVFHIKKSSLKHR